MGVWQAGGWGLGLGWAYGWDDLPRGAPVRSFTT